MNVTIDKAVIDADPKILEFLMNMNIIDENDFKRITNNYYEKCEINAIANLNQSEINNLLKIGIKVI